MAKSLGIISETNEVIAKKDTTVNVNTAEPKSSTPVSQPPRQPSMNFNRVHY